MTDNTILACKSGDVTTEALTGVARVVFTTGFDNPTNYVVFLTCLNRAVPIPVVAYPSNLANTGFTITAYILNQPGGAGVNPCTLTAPTTGVIVHWLAVIESNV